MALTAIYQMYKDLVKEAHEEALKVPVIWQVAKHEDAILEPDRETLTIEAIDNIVNDRDTPYELVDARLFTRVTLVFGGEFLVMNGLEVGRVKIEMLTREQNKLMSDLHNHYKVL